jgi:hypothetical protein
MTKAQIAGGFTAFVLAVIPAWQIASCYPSNFEFQSDVKDITSEAGVQLGHVVPRSDEDLRNLVIAKAKEYDIHLEPEQVSVRRTGTPKSPAIHLAVNYEARANLLGSSFTLHFTPSSPH